MADNDIITRLADKTTLDNVNKNTIINNEGSTIGTLSQKLSHIIDAGEAKVSALKGVQRGYINAGTNPTSIQSDGFGGDSTYDFIYDISLSPINPEKSMVTITSNKTNSSNTKSTPHIAYKLTSTTLQIHVLNASNNTTSSAILQPITWEVAEFY